MIDKKETRVFGVAAALAIAAGGPAAANVNAGLTPTRSFTEPLSPIPKVEETLASVDADPMEFPYGAELRQIHLHSRSAHHHPRAVK
jgi:hypothetical protein